MLEKKDTVYLVRMLYYMFNKTQIQRQEHQKFIYSSFYCKYPNSSNHTLNPEFAKTFDIKVQNYNNSAKNYEGCATSVYGNVKVWKRFTFKQ